MTLKKNHPSRCCASSKSEREFFMSVRDLKKNCLKPSSTKKARPLATRHTKRRGQSARKQLQCPHAFTNRKNAQHKPAVVRYCEPCRNANQAASFAHPHDLAALSQPILKQNSFRKGDTKRHKKTGASKPPVSNQEPSAHPAFRFATAPRG